LSDNVKIKLEISGINGSIHDDWLCLGQPDSDAAPSWLVDRNSIR